LIAASIIRYYLLNFYLFGIALLLVELFLRKARALL
jgi:hypothetical protein